MTAQLPGVEDYYPLLDEFNFDATVSGRHTAELEMAEQGKFEPKTDRKAGKEVYVNYAEGQKQLDVIAATHGGLLWKKGSEYENPMVIVTSEDVPAEYLEYLDKQEISYIATGKGAIDLNRAAEILTHTFGIHRLGIVGGAAINTGFLDAGLLDEIVLLIGAGIDGCASFPPVFNRKEDSVPLKKLQLLEATGNPKTGSVLVRYKVLH